MSDIEWKKEYEIGHTRIDFEHRIFVDLISKIDDAAKAGEDKAYMQRLLFELQKYAEFHFVSEENIMYSINYPDYEAHKRLHHKLIEIFQQKSALIGRGSQTIEDFVNFLKDWFVHHTLYEDKKVTDFVQGKNV